jgi:UDPglucose 6-dehydrogenase
VIVQKVISRFGKDLTGKTFAIWGLAFKPGTDDMREAPSINIINELTQLGALIQAYDPKSMGQAKNFYLKGNNQVAYFESKYDVLNGADALILATEWKEFRSPDFDEMFKRIKTPVIFDGRNQYDSQVIAKHGFEYWQIGKERVLPAAG